MLEIDVDKYYRTYGPMVREFIIFLNVTRFMRLGFGISCRFCYGGEKDQVKGFDFSGVSGSLIFAFGVF